MARLTECSSFATVGLLSVATSALYICTRELQMLYSQHYAVTPPLPKSSLLLN